MFTFGLICGILLAALLVGGGLFAYLKVRNSESGDGMLSRFGREGGSDTMTDGDRRDITRYEQESASLLAQQRGTSSTQGPYTMYDPFKGSQPPRDSMI